MDRYFLMLLMLVSSDAAFADWVEIDRSEIQITYVDPVLIDASGGRIKIVLVSNYKKPRRYEDKTFLSVKSQSEFDCSGEQFRQLEYSLHTDKMAAGEMLHSDSSKGKWQKVKASTTDGLLWAKVCSPGEGWYKVGDSGAMTAYANPFSIRKSGERVKIWELFDLKSPKARDGKEYLSVKHQAEYDCKEKLYRTLVVEYHPENMGKGKAIYIDDHIQNLEDVATESADQLFWKTACGSK